MKFSGGGELPTTTAAGAAGIETADKGLFLVAEGPSWNVVATEIPDGLVSEPGRCGVVLIRDNKETPIGSIYFGYAPAGPIKAEDRLAMLSRPKIPRKIGLEFGCKHCASHLEIVATLDDIKPQNLGSAVWYKDVPAQFKCKCGRTEVSLRLLSESMPSMFLGADLGLGKLSVDRLYTRDSVLAECQMFESVLAEHAESEESVHQFILKHSIVLSQFSAKRMWSKMQVSASYRTDFVILTERRDLLLIEIERPSRQLMRLRGSTKEIHPDTEHAINQVRGWLAEVTDHRAAVLDTFGLRPDEVNQVKGVVIVGRDSSCTPDLLRHLKSMSLGNVELYTFDDVLRGLGSVAKRITAGPMDVELAEAE